MSSLTPAETAAVLRLPSKVHQLAALTLIAEREHNYRSRVVPARGTTFSTTVATALTKLDVVRKHTVPHAGYSLTDHGRAVLDELADLADHEAETADSNAIAAEEAGQK